MKRMCDKNGQLFYYTTYNANNNAYHLNRINSSNSALFFLQILVATLTTYYIPVSYIVTV